MSKAKSSVSKADSYQEIGEYWDEHDLGEVWEQTEPVTLEVDLRSSVTYYPIETTLSAKLRSLAAQRGVSPETLLNLWVQEKLTEDATKP
jgi:hypothetical protein